MKVLALFALVSLAAAQIPFGFESELVSPFAMRSSIFHKKWTPYSSIYDSMVDPEETMLYGGSYGPYSKVGGMVVPQIYGHKFNSWSPYKRNTVGGLYTPYSTIGGLESVIGTPYDTLMTPYNTLDSVRNPLKHWENMVSPFNPLGDNKFNSPMLATAGLNRWDSVTPYSKKVLFDMLTRGSGFDTYAKTIIGRTKAIGHKLREVCPEIDGGMSYMSCVMEAHTRGFTCMKDVEDHPRYQVCIHKPMLKKLLRDWMVTDMEYTKQMIKCLSTPTPVDQLTVMKGVVDGSRLGPDDDLSSEVANKEIQRPHLKVDRFGYNVEYKTNTRQCFYEMRTKVSECTEMAKQCPKFNKCHEHSTMMMLKSERNMMMNKFVKTMDMCLNGGMMNTVSATEQMLTTGQFDNSVFSGMQNIIPTEGIMDLGF